MNGFPSPSGVLFLQTNTEHFHELQSRVSVPFRGSILTNLMLYTSNGSGYCFRPLPGFYSYKLLVLATVGGIPSGFRPLPGFYSYKRMFYGRYKKHFSVSVPFRGSILTNLIPEGRMKKSGVFPSPSGVLFLQTVFLHLWMRTKCFRPLPGFYSYKPSAGSEHNE